MDTAEVYVEPILIGALALALLAIPFSPEIIAFAQSEKLKLPGGIALGAVLVGIAYLIGILADRLIYSCLEALERHNRVRFALSGLGRGVRGNGGSTQGCVGQPPKGRSFSRGAISLDGPRRS